MGVAADCIHAPWSGPLSSTPLMAVITSPRHKLEFLHEGRVFGLAYPQRNHVLSVEDGLEREHLHAAAPGLHASRLPQHASRRLLALDARGSGRLRAAMRAYEQRAERRPKARDVTHGRVPSVVAKEYAVGVDGGDRAAVGKRVADADSSARLRARIRDDRAQHIQCRTRHDAGEAHGGRRRRLLQGRRGSRRTRMAGGGSAAAAPKRQEAAEGEDRRRGSVRRRAPHTSRSSTVIDAMFIGDPEGEGGTAGRQPTLHIICRQIESRASNAAVTAAGSSPTRRSSARPRR